MVAKILRRQRMVAGEIGHQAQGRWLLAAATCQGSLQKRSAQPEGKAPNNDFLRSLGYQNR